MILPIEIDKKIYKYKTNYPYTVKVDSLFDLNKNIFLNNRLWLENYGEINKIVNQEYPLVSDENIYYKFYYIEVFGRKYYPYYYYIKNLTGNKKVNITVFEKKSLVYKITSLLHI